MSEQIVAVKSRRVKMTAEAFRIYNAAKSRKWLAKNRERVKAKRRAAYALNPEKYRANSRKDYYKHTEKRKAAYRRWVDNNPEKAREGKRAWRKKNPASVKRSDHRSYQKNHTRRKAESKLYYLEHKNKIRTVQRAWYRRNYTQARKARNRWRALNLERAKQLCRDWFKSPIGRATAKHYAHQRRVRANSSSNTVTPEQIATLLKKAKSCFYCEKTFNDKRKPTLDHVAPLSKGGAHAVDNLVLACRSCNSKKNAKHPHEYAREIGRLLI